VVTHCRNLFSLITLPPLCHRPPRRLSDKGTLQLSIDTDSIRRALLEFPKAGRPLDEEGDTAAYTHYVEREMGQAINLVKVLQVRNGAAWHGGRWGGGGGVVCGQWWAQGRPPPATATHAPVCPFSPRFPSAL
jgi:hypothetical protein